jgi:peptide deformylase
MELLKFPHYLLFLECPQVRVFEKELSVLLNSMWETMQANNGLGLAANQVGLRLRMFVMQGPDEEKLFLVNPTVTNKSLVSANLKEGCLSAPGEFLILKERASWVEVQFQDEIGTFQKRVFHGLHAVCVQHEIDHLDGKSHLESPSIPKPKRKELKKKWNLR